MQAFKRFFVVFLFTISISIVAMDFFDAVEKGFFVEYVEDLFDEICDDVSSLEVQLFKAARQGEDKKVEYLLLKKVDINEVDYRKMTALSVAALYGSKGVVVLLLGHGAIVDPVDQFERTPLIHAIHQNYPDVVKELIKLGSQYHKADNHGKTPYDYARQWNRKDIITFFKELEDND